MDEGYRALNMIGVGAKVLGILTIIGAVFGAANGLYGGRNALKASLTPPEIDADVIKTK